MTQVMGSPRRFIVYGDLWMIVDNINRHDSVLEGPGTVGRKVTLEVESSRVGLFPTVGGTPTRTIGQDAIRDYLMSPGKSISFADNPERSETIRPLVGPSPSTRPLAVRSNDSNFRWVWTIETCLPDAYVQPSYQLQ